MAAGLEFQLKRLQFDLSILEKKEEKKYKEKVQEKLTPLSS